MDFIQFYKLMKVSKKLEKSMAYFGINLRIVIKLKLHTLLNYSNLASFMKYFWSLIYEFC